jgi:hypothetical protein
MANRTFNDSQALEKEVKKLFAKISIGASGAPTLVTPGSLGIASIARVSTGYYRLTLQDAYPFFLGFDPIVMSTTAENLNFQLRTETVSTTKIIEFYTLAAGAVADPANGDVLLLEISLKNTSVKF